MLLILLALPAQAACGDRSLDSGENCDDGNALGGDGCGEDCQIEAGWNCIVNTFLLDYTEYVTDDGPHTVPDWTRSDDGLTISQTQNSHATVYVSTLPITGVTVTFDLTVASIDDDDFIGWAFGYDRGELTSDFADWWLFDWKQGEQTYGDWGLARMGLALSHVTGASSAGELWSHSGDVSEILRATTLGSTPWVDNTTYRITMAYNVNSIQVWIDGNLEFDTIGNFPYSSFSFYAFSQENVVYTLVEPTEITACTALDSDNDGLTDPDEYTHQTDINNPDTDGDGYGDAEEVANGSDPLNPDDPALVDSGDSEPVFDSPAPQDSEIPQDTEAAAPIDSGCGCGNSKALLFLPLLGFLRRRR